MSKRILVAEDEKPIREILESKLKEQGYEILTCSDGEECITMAQSKLPDLVILDIIMPRKDGIQVLKEFTSYPWAKKIPVIVLTNKSDVETQKTAHDYGARLYLVKAETRLEYAIQKVKELLGEP